MADGSRYWMTTDRIGFRRWTAEDLPLALAIWGDPLVTRLVADLGNPGVEQARVRLEREIANEQQFGVQYWPTFLLGDGQHLGCCGLRPYRPDEGTFEVGAHLLPQWWGQGLATEAVAAVLAHAFGPLRSRGLFARHNPHNHGSARILEKLGFRHTHDEHMPQTGLAHPCYELRAEEYLGRGGG
jgi:ribosomal-protein-alanine N-acetyltransferase